MAQLHSTAVVDPAVELAADVSVGPYAVIGAGVRVGTGTTIGAHCVAVSTGGFDGGALEAAGADVVVSNLRAEEVRSAFGRTEP